MVWRVCMKRLQIRVYVYYSIDCVHITYKYTFHKQRTKVMSTSASFVDVQIISNSNIPRNAGLGYILVIFVKHISWIKIILSLYLFILNTCLYNFIELVDNNNMNTLYMKTKYQQCNISERHMSHWVRCEYYKTIHNE